jgi:branched-chain amino acid transport system permease protein
MTWRNPQLRRDPEKVPVHPHLPVGRRRWWPRLRAHGGNTWRRMRYPLTRRHVLWTRGEYNPRNLAAEVRILDKRPLWWMAGLAFLAIAPLLTDDGTILSAASIFAIYAAINLVWMLVIGTAGITSLATLAIVGAGAYGGAYLSITYDWPWWSMLPVGGAIGLVFGVIVALPAIRLEGFYYALLTLGLAELCRVYVVQSRVFGSATGGLYGAATHIPDDLSDTGQLRFAYYAAFALMLCALAVYRWVDGQRLGRLLRAAPEKNEAFAEAVGIDYRRARIQVFIISSVALGVIGGFYASHFKGASPSLFSMDSLLLMLAMIVIGGIGKAEGAVVGTLIVVAIDKVLIDLGALRLILIGAVMLVSVLTTRAGLFGIQAQFRAWREKKKSERRARRQEKGGEVVPEEATEIADKQAIYHRRFDKQMRDFLKTLVTDEVVEEHRAKPLGQHSEALSRLTNYFRRGPMADKYAVFTVVPMREYRVVALSGQRGVPPRLVNDRTYLSLGDAYHAVFLLRINDLLES